MEFQTRVQTISTEVFGFLLRVCGAYLAVTGTIGLLAAMGMSSQFGEMSRMSGLSDPSEGLVLPTLGSIALGVALLYFASPIIEFAYRDRKNKRSERVERVKSNMRRHDVRARESD